MVAAIGILKIGNLVFNSYNEFEETYIKKWEALHIIAPNFEWILADWNYRIEKQNHSATE